MIIITQQNSRCKLCSDRDKTINNILNESIKLAHKECKNRQDQVGKGISWELCEKVKL